MMDKVRWPYSLLTYFRTNLQSHNSHSRDMTGQVILAFRVARVVAASEAGTGYLVFFHGGRGAGGRPLLRYVIVDCLDDALCSLGLLRLQRLCIIVNSIWNFKWNREIINEMQNLARAEQIWFGVSIRKCLGKNNTSELSTYRYLIEFTHNIV